MKAGVALHAERIVDPADLIFEVGAEGFRHSNVLKPRRIDRSLSFTHLTLPMRQEEG